jgi:hypothetical protein
LSAAVDLPNVPLPRGFPAEDSAGRDSAARFGPAWTGRNLCPRRIPGELGCPPGLADGGVPTEGSVAAGSVGDESVDGAVSSAHATPMPKPSPVVTAAPIPRVTASAPTRPMYLALPMMILLSRNPAVGDGESTRRYCEATPKESGVSLLNNRPSSSLQEDRFVFNYFTEVGYASVSRKGTLGDVMDERDLLDLARTCAADHTSPGWKRPYRPN